MDPVAPSPIAVSTLYDLQKGEASCIKINSWDVAVMQSGRLNDWKGFIENHLCHVATRGKISVCVLFGDLKCRTIGLRTWQ